MGPLEDCRMVGQAPDVCLDQPKGWMDWALGRQKQNGKYWVRHAA
jgi:hypothetical protein